jgi:hypothetical protein
VSAAVVPAGNEGRGGADGARPDDPLGAAIAELDRMLRAGASGSPDPDRRRMARRLAELARCDDDDLAAFARRHLPGRAIDDGALRAARDLVVAIGGVLGRSDAAPETWRALEGARSSFADGLAAAERVAAARVEDERGAAERAAAAREEGEREAARAIEAGARRQEVAREGQAARAEAIAPRPALVDDPETVTVTAPIRAPLAAAPMPFAAAQAAPAAGAAPLSHRAPPVVEGPRPAEKIDLGATTTAVSPFELGALASKVLPFAAQRTAPPRDRNQQGSALPFRPGAAQPAAPQAPAEPPSPPKAAPATPPALSLEQYAGMVVACELYPAYVEATHQRYGVSSPAARAAVDAYWQARIRADATVAARWRELREAARQHFLRQP